jgi:hypothetical protein
MDKKKDFFVSYNKSDRFWAAGIREWLLGSGRTVIMQGPDFQPGSNFVIEMHEGLRSAKRMIGVLSPEYLDSRFCSSEWAAKFAEDPIGSERLLIFVKVRECKLDGLLGQIVNIDLAGLTVETAEAKFFEDLDSITSSRRNPKPRRCGSEASRGSEKSVPAAGHSHQSAIEGNTFPEHWNSKQSESSLLNPARDQAGTGTHHPESACRDQCETERARRTRGDGGGE